MLALVFRYSDTIMKLVITGFGSIVTVTTVSRTLVNEKKEEKVGKTSKRFFEKSFNFHDVYGIPVIRVHLPFNNPKRANPNSF